VDLTDFVGGRSVTGDWGSCGRVSLLDSAPGLVYLAHSSPEECDADLAACRPPEWTRADEFRLRQRLGEVRRTGVAVLPGDAPGDPVWVSAPVFDHGGTVRTTLSVVAPAYRLNVPGVRHAVNGAAHAMTQALHGQARPAARTVTYPKPGVRTA
jgi:DNA-binding IclR family transcriptional regulator